VGFLRIDGAFRQNVDAGAHCGDAEEFEVEFVFTRALAREIVDVEEARREVCAFAKRRGKPRL
jgi:hypothetical protein